MRTMVVSWGVALLLSSAAVAQTPAQPQEDRTRIEALQWSEEDQFVTVTGRATFAGAAEVVGEDPAGDAAVPGIGADLVEARIEPTAPDELLFTLEVADPPPELHGTPELVGYNWNFTVLEDGETVGDFRLQGIRSATAEDLWQRRPPSAQPILRVVPCTTDAAGSRTCPNRDGIELDGRMEDGAIEWAVPAGLIDARPGLVVAEASGAVNTGLSLSGFVWFQSLGGDSMTVAPYTIPAPEVRAGFVPADADFATVDLPAVADLTLPDGEFSATIQRPAAGEPPQELVVRACFDPDTCGWRTVPLGPFDDGCGGPVEPVEICGLTVVTGVGGSTVRVNVPEEAILDGRTGGFIDRFLEIDLEGTSPMLGFVLSDNRPEAGGGRYLQAIRLRADYHHLSQDHIMTSLAEPEPGRYLVSAGDYSLYLVSDGSPVTASIPFENLEDEGQVTAWRRTAFDFHVLENILDPREAGQRNAYSTGAGATFEHGGLWTITVDSRPPLTDADGSGFCFYFGEPQDDTTAYLPGCPARYTDDITAFELRYLPSPNAGWQEWSWGTSGPGGGRGAGFWRIGANPVVRLGALAFFLGFEEPGAPPTNDLPPDDQVTPEAVHHEVLRPGGDERRVPVRQDWEPPRRTDFDRIKGD